MRKVEKIRYVIRTAGTLNYCGALGRKNRLELSMVSQEFGFLSGLNVTEALQFWV